MTKQPKPKKCRVCRKVFQQVRAIQPVCDDMACKIEYATNAAKRAKIKREAKAKRELREAKVKAKTRGQLIKEAQTAVNAYCRLRDMKAGHGCICCGKPFEQQRPGGSVDAGHYLSRGAYPELRFEEKNIHAQRKSCNRPGGTTAASFRLGMIERVGIEVVEWLESNHGPRHYSMDELREIKATYKMKVRDLKRLAQDIK